MNIYVGNLPRSVNEDAIREHFATYGEISSIKIIKDQVTGEPRGFAFIDMPDDEAAKRVIDELNGKELGGRRLTINEARPKTGGGDRPRRDDSRGNRF